jgi:hypothetical protein
VKSVLLEDCSRGLKEEKGHLCAFKQCVHRRVAAGCEENRKMVARDGAAVRRVAMMST